MHTHDDDHYGDELDDDRAVQAQAECTTYCLPSSSKREAALGVLG